MLISSSKNLINALRTDITSHELQSVSVERAKNQLRLLDDDDDAMILRYIMTATNDIEGWAGYFANPATCTAYFNYCPYCYLYYFLEKRPFYSIETVEVLQDDAYVELSTDEYKLIEKTWGVEVYIDSDVEVDYNSTFDPDDQVTDQIKITYNVGNKTEVDISQIETTTVSTPNIATVDTDSIHGLLDNDMAIISDTTVDDYNGIFSITKTSSVQFTYEFTGSDGGTQTVGTVTVPDVDSGLELAVLQMVSGMYTNRGDCSDECGRIPCSAQNLVSHLKRRNFRTGKVNHECCCCR